MKRNAALLESVVHIMQKHMIVFGCVIEQTIERQNFKAGRIFPQSLESGEDGRASEFVSHFLGNGQRIIADSIDSSGNSGNDLENRAQTETVWTWRCWFPEFCRGSAAAYSRMVSEAICSQRNVSAI